MVKLTEKQLNEKIHQESIGNRFLLYSYAEKKNKSVGSTRRLLILNPAED